MRGARDRAVTSRRASERISALRNTAGWIGSLSPTASDNHHIGNEIMQLVFDGHNDVLLRLWRSMKAGGDPVAEFAGGTAGGHIDAPRAKKGGLVGGLCAIYIPSGDLVLSDPDADG